MTIYGDGFSFELVSPIEGVVTHVNDDVIKNPALALSDPYKDGWIATLKAPDFNTNQRNLMQASMVAPWMRYNQTRLNAEVAKLNPALAQDGGVPVSGLLQRLTRNCARGSSPNSFSTEQLGTEENWNAQDQSNPDRHHQVRRLSHPDQKLDDQTS